MSQEQLQDVRFNATNNYRIGVAAAASITAIIVVGLLGEHAGATPVGIPIGVAVAMYFIFPVYVVKEHALVFRYGFSKWTFAFDQGPFRVERLSGFKSFMRSMKPNSYGLRATGYKNRAIQVAIPDHHFAELLQVMRQRGAVIEGDTEGLL
jgi:hypothetical protein